MPTARAVSRRSERAFGRSDLGLLNCPCVGRRECGGRWPMERKKMPVNLLMPVLVVDDYNTMVRIIRNLLKQLGFEDVDDAADGTTALARMRDRKYGLVISDWNMEPMTGYDLLPEVRADPNLAS